MFRRFAGITVLLGFALLAASPRASSTTDLELTISGDDFQVNGVTKFLPIISYFDAIHGELAEIEADFALLKADKFEGVRIFPNWYRSEGPYDISTKYYAPDTLFDKDGNLRSGTLNKLLDILDAAKEAGLIVDLSFTVETVVDCPLDNCALGSASTALTFEEYKDALEDITTVLANGGSAYKHVMFDLQNEYDNNDPSDQAWDYSEMDELAEAVHAIDPDRIVMASLGANSGFSASQAADQADLAELDVATFHEPRVENWGNDSDQNGIDMDGATSLPVYFQESPRYRDDGGAQDTDGWWDSEQAEKSLYEAYLGGGGVAAWNFHTRAGFALNDSFSGVGDSIYENMLSTEQSFAQTRLEVILNCVTNSNCPTADLAPAPSAFSSWFSNPFMARFARPVAVIASVLRRSRR